MAARIFVSNTPLRYRKMQFDLPYNRIYRWRMFRRRLGPESASNQCQALRSCPDILEMDSGDFAVIGQNITAAALEQLPPFARCGPEESIVQIPRKILVLAKAHIPDSI